MKVHYIHIRARFNGVAKTTGGYTVAVTLEHPTHLGKYVANLAKCPDDKDYSQERGAGVARARLAGETHIVLPNKAALQELVNKLSSKISKGEFVVPINITHVPEMSA